MGIKTTSTSTVNIPIYAAWECSKCGEKNFSEGVLSFSASSSTKSFATKKELERIENNSKTWVNELWKSKALGIISDPIKNYSRFRESFHLHNKRCHNCNNKEKWNKGTGYLVFAGIGLPLTIISVLCLFSNVTNLSAWLFFIFSISILGCGFYFEYHFKTILKKIPKNSMPIIGSLNPELNELMEENNYKLLSPEEVFNSISIEKQSVIENKNNSEENVEIGETSQDKSKEYIKDELFCRKCGTQLLEDSEFCHKCGCETIR